MAAQNEAAQATAAAEAARQSQSDDSTRSSKVRAVGAGESPF